MYWYLEKKIFVMCYSCGMTFSCRDEDFIWEVQFEHICGLEGTAWRAQSLEVVLRPPGKVPELSFEYGVR